MADKALLGDTIVTKSYPIETNIYPKAGDEAVPIIDESPPPYQSPQIDFSGGWKDRAFAILFYIHIVLVIVVGLALGIPAILPYFKDDTFTELRQTSTSSSIKPFLFGLGGATAVGGFASLLCFFILQLCTGRLIVCSFIITITMQVLVGIGLFFLFWPLCFIPGIFLFFTLIYITCVRKRIAFAEVHLRAGLAALRGHPSLVIIALIMLLVELLWFIFWFLMVLGIQHASTNSTLISNINTTTNVNNTTTLTLSNTTTYMTGRKSQLNNSPTYLMNEKPKSINSTIDRLDRFTMKLNKTSERLDRILMKLNRTTSSTSSTEVWYKRWVHNFIVFLLLLSWYWGANTFGNIAHFITACTVGQWWFTDDVSRQYAIRTSVKRAFTTNFGTICLGSLFEAFIRALRSCAEDNSRKNILSCFFVCILKAIERLVGYLNEWAFIYSAITGQTYVEASRTFIELFKKRGWTLIINDTLIGTTLLLINIVVGLASAAAGGVIVYFLAPNRSEEIIPGIVIISIICFLIGIMMSTIITTILISCVRTIFVCFALNPAVLGATHPDHLQHLTKVWHKVYPAEFATSGYADRFPKPVSV